MQTERMEPRRSAGQMIAMFALVLTVIVMFMGLVIDGGNALVQRRNSQNASDFAALAGARIIAQRVSGDTTNGTDANVRAAIVAAIAVNKSDAITFGAPGGPSYVNQQGGVVPSAGSAGSFVGNGTIPVGAVGVRVHSKTTWNPYFLGIIGVTNWTASTAATARGGYAAGAPAGNLFPVGIAEAFFNGRTPCAGDVSSVPTNVCYPAHLTPGSLNVPGGFGWLKFGCSGYGLGQGSAGGCDNSKPFLQSEIGPPSNSHGCCAQTGVAGSGDRIGSVPGNKASADCSYFINNKTVVTIPVWDSASGTGQNASYHIIGFTGFQITACNGGKDIEGVWRVPFFLGPTTSTPGFAGAALAVQLLK